MTEKTPAHRLAWSIYREKVWLKNMIAHHEATLAHYRELDDYNNLRIERWENYLKTGK